MDKDKAQATAHGKERDERVVIPLDPEEALRALLKVSPNSEPPARPTRTAEPDGNDADRS